LTTQRVITERIVANTMQQIFSAVEYCHKNKIVHRDLKPENIVYVGSSIESTIKVIDFGRSAILLPKTKMKEKAGTVYLNLLFNFNSFIILLLKYLMEMNIMKNVIYGVVELSCI